MTASSGADKSRDYYSLNYRDPTGEAAVRNLMGRTVTLTSEDGFLLFLNIEDLRPYLQTLDFRQSRKGHVWGSRKKKTPVAAGVQDQNTNPYEGERS